MPREATITTEQIAAVANSILAEGGKPTLRLVRERLGSGSLGTVQRLLADWRAKHAPKAAIERVIPTALQRVLLDYLAQEVARERAAIEASLADALQEAKDLAIENERVAEASLERLSDLDAQKREVARLGGQLNQVEREIVTVKAEASAEIDAARHAAQRERDAAEQARQALARAELRLEGLPRLESQNDELGKALKAAEVAQSVAERQAAAAQASLDATAKRVEDLEAALKEQKQRTMETIGKLEESKQRMEAELRELRADLRQVAEAAAELRGKTQSREHDNAGGSPLPRRTEKPVAG